MPQMKPPHYQGVMYGGAKIAEGATVEVREIDVAALAFEGWTLADEHPAPPEKDEHQ